MIRNRILFRRVMITLAVIPFVFIYCNDAANEPVAAGMIVDTREQQKLAALAVGNVDFHFTEMPYSDPDLVNPGRGAEEWLGMSVVNIPAEGAPVQSMDAYNRFNWTSFENETRGVFDWTVFDKAIQAAIDRKQKFSFGIMTVYPGGKGNPGVVEYDGGFAAYPRWVHEAMQAENVKDWQFEGGWIPNWNSAVYLRAWEDLNIALNAHILEGSYKGIRYRDVINYIDIRGYGSFGEWHAHPYKGDMPSGTRPGAPVLIRIIHATKNAYPAFQLVAMSDAFNPGGWSDMPVEVTYELLTGRNAYNEFGWRRDNWGDAHDWYPKYLEKNPNSWQGQSFRELIMNKWKKAPVLGEPLQCCTKDGGDCQYWELKKQVERYHTAMFGNGNLENPAADCVKDNIRAAAKAAGYRIVLSGGSAPAAIEKSSSFVIKTGWQNKGVAPAYFDEWAVVFELQDAKGKTAWTGTSSLQLTSFLPQEQETAILDSFSLPADVPAGSYKLVVRVKDAKGYRSDLLLAVKGRNGDGSYTLLPAVVVAK